MDDHDKLLRELRALVIEAVGLDDIEPEELAFDEPLFGEALGLDSIDALDIAMGLEKQFDVKVTPEVATAETFHSLETLAVLVETLRTRAPAETPAP